MMAADGFVIEGVPLPIFWLFVGLAILIQGIGKSGFAGGAGIVSLPLMMLVMPAGLVPAAMLPLLILCDLNAIYHHWNNKVWTRIMEIYIPSLVGIGIGAFMWWRMGEAGIEQYELPLKRFVGVIAMLFAIYIFAKERAMHWVERFRPNPLMSLIVGSVSGLTSTLIHAAGPIVSLYIFMYGMGKTLFVGTVAWTFTLINITKLPFYIAFDMVSIEVLRLDVMLIPLIPIGSYMGKWMHDRVSEKAFNRVILVVVFVAGIQLLLNVNLILWVVEALR